MAKKLIYISTIIFFISILAIVADRMAAKKYNNKYYGNIQVEVGDILFRSYSYTLSNSSLYYLSGMPGHIAIIVSEGGFLPATNSLKDITVVEARYYDRTKKQKSKQVGINPANENFGEKYKGRRFLFKTHLNKSQKEELVNFYKSNLGKPYKLFAQKEDQKEFNCATFAWQALYHSYGIDIDSNEGKIFFPNDIFKCPLFMDENNRIFF